MSSEWSTGAPVRSLKRAQVRTITVFFMIHILVSGGSFGIEDMVSSSGPGLPLLGQDVSWYGIAGFAALLSGPVLYYVFRAIYGGPSTPSRETGDDAIAIAEAEAAEDAA